MRPLLIKMEKKVEIEKRSPRLKNSFIFILLIKNFLKVCKRKQIRSWWKHMWIYKFQYLWMNDCFPPLIVREALPRRHPTFFNWKFNYFSFIQMPRAHVCSAKRHVIQEGLRKWIWCNWVRVISWTDCRLVNPLITDETWPTIEFQRSTLWLMKIS